MELRALVACAVLLGLSGCAASTNDASGADETTGAATTPPPSGTANLDSEENETLRQAGKGALRGRVHDDYNFSIEAAHVALLGTNFFADTGRDGFFRIDNLTARTYDVNVGHPRFSAPFRTEVEVTIGRITFLDVTLIRPFDPNATFISTPHAHDWWGEDTQVTILDRDIRMAPGGVCWMVRLSNACGPNGGSGPLDGESYIDFEATPDPTQRPKLVFEGTGRLSRTIRIEGVVAAGFDVFVRNPAHAFEKKLTVTGNDAHVDIPVNESMTDAPHVRLSAWQFHLEPTSHEPTPGVKEKASLYGTKMHWTVVVHRSDWPLRVAEPHPDYWGADVNRTLLSEGVEDRCVRAGGASGTPYGSCSMNWVSLPEKKTVTIGTARMRVTLDWQSKLVVPTILGLEYADATTDSDRVRWMRPSGTMDGTHVRIFDFPVRPDQWDSPYVKNSRWMFRWYFDNQPGGEDGAFEGTVTYKVEIFKIGT